MRRRDAPRDHRARGAPSRARAATSSPHACVRARRGR
jgi:hypothetical protein